MLEPVETTMFVYMVISRASMTVDKYLIGQPHLCVQAMRLFVACNSIALVEAVNATCGVNQFLLTSVEWVAGRADFHVDVFHCRAGLNHVAANAGDFCKFVVGVDSLFHKITPYLARQQRTTSRLRHHTFAKLRKQKPQDQCLILPLLSPKLLPQERK